MYYKQNNKLKLKQIAIIMTNKQINYKKIYQNQKYKNKIMKVNYNKKIQNQSYNNKII